MNGQPDMLQADVLAILRCPDDHSELAVASQEVVDQVNESIRKGRLVNRAGKWVDRSIDGGLVRADRAVLYPIIDHIPVLLRDDAILLSQLAD